MLIIDDEQRRLHSRRSMRVMNWGLLAVVVLVLAAPVSAISAQSLPFLRFNLGFFIIAHGLVAGMIAVVYWFISSQESADRDFNITTHV